LIVDSFTKVATLITDITTSGEEQARGIDEVNVAVSQLDSATQQNAAMVEQTTASARTLSELAQNLNGLVGFFKLEESKVAEFMPYFEEKKAVNS
jgi:methyl-accepting chemotaxis protein